MKVETIDTAHALDGFRGASAALARMEAKVRDASAEATGARRRQCLDALESITQTRKVWITTTAAVVAAIGPYLGTLAFHQTPFGRHSQMGGMF